MGTDLTLSPTTLAKFRAGSRSLRGLRLLRTQLHDQPLNQESLTDLAYLRLDLIGVLSVTAEGNPGNLYLAYLLPPSKTGQLCNILKTTPFHQCTIAFDQFIRELEAEMQLALQATTSVRRGVGDFSQRLLSKSSRTGRPAGRTGGTGDLCRRHRHRSSSPADTGRPSTLSVGKRETEGCADPDFAQGRRHGDLGPDTIPCPIACHFRDDGHQGHRPHPAYFGYLCPTCP